MMYNTAYALPKVALKTYKEESLFLGVGDSKTARVLLIEDDRATRRMVKAGLKDQCEIVEAPDAGQGITNYKAFQPDIVFMDIELPDGDGYDLMSWILRNDPGAFIVMFSGHSDTDNVIKSAQMGARGFISKPFDLSKMMHFINRCPRLH